MNLKQETLQLMSKNGMGIEDIAYISNRDFDQSVPVDEFFRSADREYDNGHGLREVNLDMIIVFTNGDRMMRQEYDGSEWWEYIQAAPLTPPLVAVPLPIWNEDSIYGS